MNDLFETLKRHGAVTSRRDFSRWAGKSPSYLATVRAPSEGVMLAVLRKLIAERRWLLALRVARMVLADPRRRSA